MRACVRVCVHGGGRGASGRTGAELLDLEVGVEVDAELEVVDGAAAVVVEDAEDAAQLRDGKVDPQLALDDRAELAPLDRAAQIGVELAYHVVMGGPGFGCGPGVRVGPGMRVGRRCAAHGRQRERPRR